MLLSNSHRILRITGGGGAGIEGRAGGVNCRVNALSGAERGDMQGSLQSSFDASYWGVPTTTILRPITKPG